MIRPQAPSERITLRNTVSVTPAMGARIVAGRTTRLRIVIAAGNISHPLPVGRLQPRFVGPFVGLVLGRRFAEARRRHSRPRNDPGSAGLGQTGPELREQRLFRASEEIV